MKELSEQSLPVLVAESVLELGQVVGLELLVQELAQVVGLAQEQVQHMLPQLRSRLLAMQLLH
jgi:ribosomal protein L7Ae-like RNA K-turn-binding protein